MTKKIVLAAAVALLAVPAAAAEERPPAPEDKPERAEKAAKREAAAPKKLRKHELRLALRQCKALRRELGAEGFAALYPTARACVRARAEAERAHRADAKAECLAKLGKHAKGRRLAACLARHAAADSALEREQVVNAARACAEKLAADPAGFRAEYGKNRNLANAFGKCVSAKAGGEADDEKHADEEQKDEEEEEDEPDDAVVEDEAEEQRPGDE